MKDFRRRLLMCALIVVSSIVVTETQQQQRGRGQQKSRADMAADAGGVVTSVDSDGVPKFIWAAGARPGPIDATHDGAARWHLRRFASAFDVTATDVSTADAVSVQTLTSGDVIVELRQRVGGVEVMGSDVKVMMRGDHRLVAISGRPRASGGADLRWQQSREAALAAALSAQFGSAVSASSIATETTAGGEDRFRVAGGPRLYMSEAAPVRPVMFPVGGRLVAAYVTEFYAGLIDSVDSLAFRYVIAADDGRVLDRRDLTVSEKKNPPSSPPPVDFLYRVYAEPSNQRPLDGPQQDLSPHPTGFPDGTTSPFLPSNLVTMGGFNNPPSGAADPWLAPDATETNGNNADAYVDFSAPDGLTPGVDFRANVTSARSFDRTYDTTLGPTATVDQSKAAITNAFYSVNWLHDYWYDSGFDEAAGNAQLSNYGRGGVEGDPMRVEVQDNFLGGSRNNANMSTPSDGLRPRMQMFTWFGPQAATLTLTPGGNVQVGVASFGPFNFDITAQVALANDGVGTLTDACEPLVGFIPGRIALADRGTCGFTIKARNAQAAGAVGILIANNVAGTVPPGLGGTDPLVTIGAMSITQAAGVALKASLVAGPVSARMFRLTGTERDGAIDNTIVAHEWGHYLHHRLADCGQFQCGAMSEGWGDFVALHTIARDGDNLNGTFALATYSTSAFDPNSAYFGIRRVPYSIDFTKNALTFKHITNGVPLPPVPTLPGGPNSEVHNAGEIWTTMLWEGYVALQKARGSDSFDDVRRRMADYVVGGLKLAPLDATYTEQRDAILAAAASGNGDDDHGHGHGGKHSQPAGASDMLTLATAFARRGAGSCAVSPPRDSVDFAGVVESFELKPRIGIGEVRLDEDKSCDQDGFVDAGERGTIVVPVMNAGPVEMRNTTVSVTTSTPGVSFRHGSSVRIARIEPFGSVEAQIEIEVDSTFTGIGQLQVNVSVSSDEACEPLLSRSFNAWINVDESLNASTVDTVETPTTPWTAAGADADQIWSRVEVTPFNRAWFGLDFGAPSDTTLESPALLVGTTAPFVIAFDHRFGFEADNSTSPPTFFDGGMIEISRNGGPWEDISNFVAPGYGGTLFIGSDNPLGGRPAFVGRSASFPARNHLTLDLGTAFAGQTVRIRFRIGTDAAAADIGWEIDNIAFQGITNKPFAEFIADLAKCRGLPRKDN